MLWRAELSHLQLEASHGFLLLAPEPGCLCVQIQRHLIILHKNEDWTIKGPAAIENILQTLSRVEGIKRQHKVLVVVNGF